MRRDDAEAIEMGPDLFVTCIEIERDFLEDWSGSAEVKDGLVAELNRCHTANRGRLASCLAQLQREARSLEPAPPKRTDH